MHHTTRDVLGEAAYLRRSCELLIDQLKEIDRLAVGTEALTQIQEAAIGNAHRACADRAKDHLELASQYVENWRVAITDALSMEPSWLQ